MNTPTTTAGPGVDHVSRFRSWRLGQGLTLDETSDLTGLSTSMLSLVERRKRQLAPLTKVRVARRLGVRVADLFEVEPIGEAETGAPA